MDYHIKVSIVLSHRLEVNDQSRRHLHERQNKGCAKLTGK